MTAGPTPGTPTGWTVRTVTSGLFPSNCHILAAEGADACVVIDPGLDGPAIDRTVQDLGLRPTHVVCTHGHFDHAGSAALFQAKYGTPVLLHAADRKTLSASNFMLMAFKIPQRIDLPEITAVEDGHSFEAVGATFRFHATPGHTPGSCIVEFAGGFFTGDTVYRRGVGLSRLPGEDAGQLRTSILGIWDRLDGPRMVYPGHGDSAPAADIRSGNRALLDFLGLSGRAENEVA